MSTAAGDAAKDGEAAVADVTSQLNDLDGKLNGEPADEEEDGDEAAPGM